MQITQGRCSGRWRWRSTYSSVYLFQAKLNPHKPAMQREERTNALLCLHIAAVQAGLVHGINSVLKELVGILLASKAEVPSYAYKVKGKTKLYHHTWYAQHVPPKVISYDNLLVRKHLVIILWGNSTNTSHLRTARTMTFEQ